jgi:hypothetical protein
MQAECSQTQASYPAQLNAAYPELRADVQRVFSGCERRDVQSTQTKLMSYLYELHIHLAQAETGTSFSSFNSPSDFERDLVAAGFPDLDPFLDIGDPQALGEAARRFDAHLKKFLQERGVRINDFSSMKELSAALARGEV